MPTYCIPPLTGVPGFPASDFDWWTPTPPPSPPGLRYSAENPNWLGSFSISEGDGATKQLEFRALRGTLGGKDYLFLSWAIRVSALNTGIDRLNLILGDGTNYVALQVRLASASSTAAGTQDNGIFTYRMHNCSVAAGAISAVNPAIATDAANLEATGRLWVDWTNPERQLQVKWAFQVAIPLGLAWGPSPLNLPTSGALKLWYEVTASVPMGAGTVLYQVPTTPAAIHTSGILEIVPAGLLTTHMLDLSTGGGACTDGVRMDWGGVGVRNVAAGDPARPDTTTIRLDLGQDYPPNLAVNPATLYNESQTPNVAASKFQNQFFATPTFPAGLTTAQKEAVRARFSLGNWGSQVSIPTASSWRPVPGGEDVAYQSGAGESRFIWPLPAGGGADAFTTTLVRNINKFLNAVGQGNPLPASAQNPHQCMLVELRSTDPTVIFTSNSVYANMNVARASVFRRFAEISVVGLAPVGGPLRDVYLYVQKFNMPTVVVPGDGGRPNPDLRGGPGAVGGGARPPGTIDEVAAKVPTYVVHCYHDTGETMTLENGTKIPILHPQTSFGYFALHSGALHGWETRIYGAEKLAADLYRIRVPHHGSVYVETAIQARESANEASLPPDTNPGGCLGWLVALIRAIKRLLGLS